jgi:hypothetical protein
LLKQEIFTKLQRNELIEASPSEIHFNGFDLDKLPLTRVLKLINISGNIQRMTILPPQTKYFDVHYVKPVN